MAPVSWRTGFTWFTPVSGRVHAISWRLCACNSCKFTCSIQKLAIFGTFSTSSSKNLDIGKLAVSVSQYALPTSVFPPAFLTATLLSLRLASSSTFCTPFLTILVLWPCVQTRQPPDMSMKNRTITRTSLLDDVRMTQLFDARGWKQSNLKRMWRYLVQRNTTDLSEAITLKDAQRELTPDKYPLFTTTVASTSTSSDGLTTKLLVQLQDGHLVEVRATFRSVVVCACGDFLAGARSPSSCGTTSAPRCASHRKWAVGWLAASVPRGRWACAPI